MKKYSVIRWVLQLILIVVFTSPFIVCAQDTQERVAADSKAAKALFVKSDQQMKELFEKLYAYVIFPDVGKGAAGVGGAAGNGTVYEKEKMIGSAKMLQISVGLQLGGQAYREVIFFEDKAALERFKQGRLEFAGQTSAVAAKSGASSNVKYTEGVIVFTEEKSGLMYEASIGGQKFTFNPL